MNHRKDTLIFKILVKFLCCFVPSKKLRRQIKRKLIGIRSRRNKLFAYGCKIENEIITTPEGIKIDISFAPHDILEVIKEVFLQKDYTLYFANDAILIDIGLNRGTSSLFFATYPNIKRIYSFEPFKPTFEVAKRNLALNPQLSEKINAFNFGLGKTDKILEQPYIETSTSGMSTTHDVCGNEKNARKETVIIKDAAKEIKPILADNKNMHVIVKCDCEGAEFEIFERLDQEKIIEKIDVILLEYHFDKPDGLISILSKNGFAVFTKVSSRKFNTGYIYAAKTAKI